MDDHLLGFAIPAYRRPHLLDIALASVVPQAVPLGAPIYIPDNCEGRLNVAVVEKWRRIHPLIIHEINPENIGIDRNVDRAISRCPAAYVHVIGDDDVIYPGFADAVTKVLLRDRPRHLVCSYVYLTNDYAPISGRPLVPATADTDSVRRFVTSYGWAMGFIGCHVFHRPTYAGESFSAFGSYFHHVGRLLRYLSPDEPLPFIPQPLVGNRADDESTPTWSADRLAVMFGLENVMATAMNGRYETAEIEEAVLNARLRLGYAQSARLLYWGALAHRNGSGRAYWEALQRFMPGPSARLLASVPAAFYAPLIQLIPLVRGLKRLSYRLAPHEPRSSFPAPAGSGSAES